MIVLPLIFVSIISGIISINDVNTLGRLGIVTLTLYVFTTMLAITLALFVSNFIDYNIENISQNNIIQNISPIDKNSNLILNIFPDNFFLL